MQPPTRINQKGFSIVELLVILLVVGLLGFVGFSVYQRTIGTDSSNNSSTSPKPNALLYGYFDGLSMKIDSFNLEDNQKKHIFEQVVSESNTRSRPFSLLNTAVSSDKQMIAYRFRDNAKIKIIKSDGATIREVPRDDVASFTWLLDKRQLLLEKSNFVDCNGANCEAPLEGFSSDWFVYDVDSGEETKMEVGDSVFNSLAGQSSETLYFAANSPYGGVPPKLYAYNIDSQKASEVKGIPDEPDTQIGFISTSPGSKRTIISIPPSGYGVENRCTFYELDGKRLGNKIVDDANFKCGNAYWTNDNEFYFNKSTGPSGKITTSDTSTSGYYILLSVFKYSFSDNKQSEVLVSDGSEVYRLLESLPDGTFVVSNEANKRTPQYKLEIRGADGSFKAAVESNQKEMLLIGTVK